jgi:integrating conjugative element protein (TIGR03761 family)
MSMNARQSKVSVVAPKRIKLNRPTDAGLNFQRNANSPFEDGYDIEAERIVLLDLYEADTPDAKDPRFPRLLELWARETQLERAKASYKFRSGADTVVADNEAARIRLLGKMVNEDGGTDYMALHMKDAVFLFMGRASSVDGNRHFIPGAKRAASCVNHLHIKTRDDNPYADWALIQVQEAIRALNVDIEAEQERLLGIVEDWRKMGLGLQIMKTATPQRFPIAMSSPYGYLLVQQLIRFDELLRVYTTLRHKGLMDDVEYRSHVDGWKRKFRVIYESPIRFERVLSDKSMWALTRADFLPEASAASAQRVGTALAFLGDVPPAILQGVQQPFNSRRRLPKNEAETQLLSRLTISAEARNVAQTLAQTGRAAADAEATFAKQANAKPKKPKGMRKTASTVTQATQVGNNPLSVEPADQGLPSGSMTNKAGH